MNISKEIAATCVAFSTGKISVLTTAKDAAGTSVVSGVVSVEAMLYNSAINRVDFDVRVYVDGVQKGPTKYVSTVPVPINSGKAVMVVVPVMWRGLVQAGAHTYACSLTTKWVGVSGAIQAGPGSSYSIEMEMDARDSAG